MGHLARSDAALAAAEAGSCRHLTTETKRRAGPAAGPAGFDEEDAMEFLCLIYHDAHALAAMPEEVFEANPARRTASSPEEKRR